MACKKNCKCNCKQKMTELQRVLMERDELTAEEALSLMNELRDEIYSGNDPAEVLLSVGLEEDYLLDLF
jgi:hypothetical protein